MYWYFYYITIITVAIGTIDCYRTNDDYMIAEESKQNFSPSKYQQQLQHQTNINGGDILKKSASEYNSWAQNFNGGGGGGGSSRYHRTPFLPMTNKFHETDYSMTTVNQAYLKGKDINVVPEHKPITLHYRTHAQPIVVHQSRLPGPKPEVKHTTSHEEPQRVVHEVIRPIIQEVHEIIQPYRKVVQEVQPVIEEVRTIIAKDANKGSNEGDALGGNLGGALGGGGGGYNGHSNHFSGHQQQHYSAAATAAQPQLLTTLNNQKSLSLLKQQPQQQQQQLQPLFQQSISASSDVLRHLSPKTLQSYRNAMFEQSKNDEEHLLMPMASSSSLLSPSSSSSSSSPSTSTSLQQNRFIRSRVYLTQKGVPVYQSNYRAPVYLSP